MNSDATLVHNLRGPGSQLAARSLYRTYGGELYGFALRRLRDEGLAEELVQDVFTRAWRSAEQFEPGRGSVRTGLYAIARNAVIDSERRRGRRPQLPASEPACETVDPAEPIETALLRYQIQLAISRLTFEHRQVIELVHLSRPKPDRNRRPDRAGSRNRQEPPSLRHSQPAPGPGGTRGDPMNSCREFEVLLAAHAFAALEPDEHAAVETHLAGCADCRRAYSQLSELPSLLDLAGSTEARIVSPPPLLEASVLASLPVGDDRRSRRRPTFPRRRSHQGTATSGRGVRVRLLATALTAVLALVVVGVTQLPASSPRSVKLTLVPSPLAPASRAVATMRSRPWGTEIDLQAQHLAPTHGTQIYEMWFVSSRGRVSAGTFTVGSQGHATVILASAARADQYHTLGVTLEPDGLNPARRGPNILHGNLHA